METVFDYSLSTIRLEIHSSSPDRVRTGPECGEGDVGRQASARASEPLRSAHGAVNACSPARDTGVAGRGARRVPDHRVHRLQPTRPALPRATQTGAGDRAAVGLSGSRPGGEI